MLSNPTSPTHSLIINTHTHTHTLIMCRTICRGAGLEDLLFWISNVKKRKKLCSIYIEREREKTELYMHIFVWISTLKNNKSFTFFHQYSGSTAACHSSLPYSLTNSTLLTKPS